MKKQATVKAAAVKCDACMAKATTTRGPEMLPACASHAAEYDRYRFGLITRGR